MQSSPWRGAARWSRRRLTQLLGDTNWGELDYLVVDMPPGTGDIQLTLAQRVPVSGAVIVTTPQDIALLDARKGLKMFEKVEVRVLGVVENMSVHVCSHCGHAEHIFGSGGGARMAAQYGVQLLGELPLDIRIREEADGGSPTVVADPQSARAQAYLQDGAPRRRAAGDLEQGLQLGVPQDHGRGDVSIKSDRWIRRMAAEHGMIDPFSPEQVRVADGHKIISYGTSSYGYDVRCADEFKIFTNINSTIVDPKSFDEKSFVDFKGPVCIIPPNSFALASTVEYFRIPRVVLTVCLGKCVTGDTRVVDADTGAYVPITEMRWGKRTLAWDGWRLRPAKVSAFMPQGKREIFELRTRTGLRIRATANHPFRMLKRWVPLSDLRPGDRIAVAREIPVFGKTPIPEWEATLLGLMISEGQCNTPGHSPTYTTADPAMVALLEVRDGGLRAGRDHVQRPLRLSTGQSKGEAGSRSEIARMTGCEISSSTSAPATSSCRRSSSRRPRPRFACFCRRSSAATAAFISPMVASSSSITRSRGG